MIDLKNITSLRRQKANSLLGLALDGSRLEGVWLKRTNGSLQVQAAFSVVLSLDPMTNAAELVGREIRNHLDAAEIRERRCLLAVPLKWALVAHAAVPALPEADLPSFLQIEAERNFPCDVTTLATATSLVTTAAGRQATFVGVAHSQVATLEAVLRAAQLRPEGFALGITALQPPGDAGVLALTIGEQQVGVQLTCGGGVAVLRTLEGAIEIEGSRRSINPKLIARELRITLGQLPEPVRDSLKQIRVFGPRDLAHQVADELHLRFEVLDLKIEVVEAYEANAFGVQLPAKAPVSAAFSLAAAALTGRKPGFNFLPPRVSQWQQLTARYGTGKLRRAGAIAGGVLGVVLLAFLVQQIQLWRYQSRWSHMKIQVEQLEKIQADIRTYRPWYDESLRSLSILRQLTAAFPEDGVVTAKTVEIRNANLVTCTGTTRDNASLLRTLERLRAVGSVADLKVDRIQGKSPMQFTFDFRWVDGGANAN